MSDQLHLYLKDEEWPDEGINHTRIIVRAIVVDENNQYYFASITRNDIFGCGKFLETSGGGVEENESLLEAIHRELEEELGVQVEVLEKLGVVEDSYNLIHRKNINHYYLCRIVGFVPNHQTKEEQEEFHLQTRICSYQEACDLYQSCASQKLGRLIAKRELPILHRANQRLKELEEYK